MPVYITEYAGMGHQNGVANAAAKEPALANHTRTVSGTSAQSAAFNAAARVIRVHTSEICSIVIGANPTATTSDARMAANQTEYFSVEPGHKLAAITNT